MVGVLPARMPITYSHPCRTSRNFRLYSSLSLHQFNNYYRYETDKPPGRSFQITTDDQTGEQGLLQRSVLAAVVVVLKHSTGFSCRFPYHRLPFSASTWYRLRADLQEPDKLTFLERTRGRDYLVNTFIGLEQSSSWTMRRFECMSRPVPRR